MPIPVYAINLKTRSDRKASIEKEFAGKPEFGLYITEACTHTNPAKGLWMSITGVLQKAKESNLDFIVICEDDHVFTPEYSFEKLQTAIEEAKRLNVDIVLGGVSWLRSMFPVCQHLCWVEEFTGTQFVIVFKHFYDVLLNFAFFDDDTADKAMGALTKRKAFIYPFISGQKDFGYSDVTLKNNEPGKVDALFLHTRQRLKLMHEVDKFYKSQGSLAAILDLVDKEEIVLPTYIINLPERADRLTHVLKQFEGKPEFGVTVVEACRHEVGAVGLWMSIRKIVEMAKEKSEDLIIICEDDHTFTKNYSKKQFFRNVFEAGFRGSDYLSGGTGGFDTVLPVSENLYWLHPSQATQFIVVFQQFFQAILDEPFDDTVIADLRLSEMTSNKLVIYPFVSVQKDFGYSDVTHSHQQNKGLLTALFQRSDARLNKIQEAYLNFNHLSKK
ncbi:MAG: hypothetical protein QM640_02465 [Niabella sp.]